MVGEIAWARLQQRKIEVSVGDDEVRDEVGDLAESLDASCRLHPLVELAGVDLPAPKKATAPRKPAARKAA